MDDEEGKGGGMSRFWFYLIGGLILMSILAYIIFQMVTRQLSQGGG